MNLYRTMHIHGKLHAFPISYLTNLFFILTAHIAQIQTNTMIMRQKRLPMTTAIISIIGLLSFFGCLVIMIEMSIDPI